LWHITPHARAGRHPLNPRRRLRPLATRAFEQDRDRDADLLNAGFPTLRITDHRLKHHPTNEANRLK